MQARDPEISLPVGFETNLSVEYAADPANYAQYRLDVPAVVLHGSADQMILPENGERLAELIPNARYEVLDGAAHLFWREQPERVIELLHD